MKYIWNFYNITLKARILYEGVLKMNSIKRKDGVAFAISSAVTFGIIPILAIFAYRGNINTITLVFLRFFLSSVVIFAYILIKRIDFKVTKNMFLKLFFCGITSYGLTFLTLFASYNYISVGLATVLHFIYPAIVTCLSFFIFKENLSAYKIGSLILSILGVYILIGFNIKKLNMLGIILALVSGITYSIYILQIGYSSMKDINNIVLIFYISLFASLGIFLFGAVKNSISFDIEPSSYIFVICIVFMSIFSLFTLTMAVKCIGSSNSSILSTFEPITSIILSAIIFKDDITANIIIGTIFILVSVYGIVKKPRVKNNMINQHKFQNKKQV